MDTLQIDNYSVPASATPYVKRLRRFLNDRAELNILEKVQESTDLELYEALQDALDTINYTFLPSITYSSFSAFPSWLVLQYGATMQVLLSKGILSARNTLTYSDSGGVTVQDFDKYGRYINFYNMLANQFQRGFMAIKTTQNAESCYGGVDSEYATLNDNI